MERAICDASLVLCWNSRFSVPDNNALFRFVAKHLSPNAVFVCSTLPNVSVDLQEVACEFVPKEGVPYTVGIGKARGLAGRDNDWFRVYKTGIPCPHPTRTNKRKWTS
jgi:hypothetical protein